MTPPRGERLRLEGLVAHALSGRGPVVPLEGRRFAMENTEGAPFPEATAAPASPGIVRRRTTT